MTRLIRSPAVTRLDWILDGLDGVDGWGRDAADVLAADFAAAVPPEAYAALTRTRSRSYAPLVVVGVEAEGYTARARIRRPDGTLDVVVCTVAPEPPYRIVSTWVMGLVPDHVTPRLPFDFDGYDLPRAADARLIVFSGVPGAGKSTLADAVGRELAVPVFAGDWLLGALTPYGDYHRSNLLDIADELLTTLALRQLVLGQSAILDTPAEQPATRERWRSLARRAGAHFSAIVCLCPDAEAHRARVEGRHRGIPGWHDAGDWTNVARRLATFPAWDGALVVDTTRPLEPTVADVLDFTARSFG